ncbi:hypothetical protein [Thermus phage P23-45]|uniref:Uncharacterized protein n=2 Tax=Oshimavirus TaxID=1623293 RepID=A7XX59_BP234|nr:hypothetical protein P23p34 [Thermus phage P23-45]YP_001468002.1 hypothetical protein P74p32 [Thermus phage P74-26]API81840.1 hypothetical protein G20c_32 [Thermus phage G20c]ABU96867.1 hypothetical protein P23p34 [Thermus phage P23-45]ABU96982.1 hypothetical protein P74p32 [Thermus phage P74-26]UYB98440.1 hypothetical protein [Thermus phage P23-45]
MLLPNFGDVALAAKFIDPSAKVDIKDGYLYIYSPLATKMVFPGLVREELANGVVRFAYPKFALAVSHGHLILTTEDGFFYPL